MAWTRGGQAHVKGRAPPGGTDCPQAPTMRLNDRSADAKPHAGAVGFGCKERVEYLFRQLRRKPYAGITDRHKNLVAFSAPRLDDHLSYPVNVLHRLDAVDDQIHRDLLQLHAIADDLRNIVGQFRPDRDVVSPCLAAQEGDGFSIDLVYINNLALEGTSFELRADSGDYRSCTLRISCDSGDSRAHSIHHFRASAGRCRRW
jgi:hypothetical protein